MDFQVIIPARYASSRFPGKPLCEINGLPMLAHVYQRACDSGASRVIVATDDLRIQTVAQAFGAEVWLTDPAHPSGTDRVAEVARRCGLPDSALVVNLQGDEPTMPPALIRQAAATLAAHAEADVATLCEAITDPAEVTNPNWVKVVRDRHDYALYFSRAPIPWVRDVTQPSVLGTPSASGYFRHIGLYAYRAGYLQTLTALPACALEQDEALEQLRVLYHGGRIQVPLACAAPGPGIDTPADLERLRQWWRVAQH